MSELDVTILAETPKDAQAIERLHERTFGPGRFVLSAYRLREHVDHLLDLSFTARIGTLLVGSVRQLPICIGDTPALMLGPLTVEPPFRKRGVGRIGARRGKCSASAGMIELLGLFRSQSDGFLLTPVVSPAGRVPPAACCNSCRNSSRLSWMDATTSPIATPRPISAASDNNKLASMVSGTASVTPI